MRENLRDFICREAGQDEASRLDLIRHLAQYILVAGGYDFNELRQLIQDGPSWEDSFGSEYVSNTWPEVPVVDPLPCITIRPFIPDGYTTTPYKLVERLAWHLRDVMVGAESVPDFDGVLRFGYIEPENIARWKEAAQRWRTSQVDGKPQTTTGTKPAPAPAPTARVHTTKGRREHWLDAAFKIACEKAADPTSLMSVWQALCALSLSASPPEPLMGMLGKNIKHRDGNGHDLYNYDAFAKYWKRKLTPTNAT